MRRRVQPQAATDLPLALCDFLLGVTRSPTEIEALQMRGIQYDSFLQFDLDQLPEAELAALWTRHGPALRDEAQRRGIALPLLGRIIRPAAPQRSLHYMWGHIDPWHGDGPWQWDRFAAALARDRADIEADIAAHPEHADRLRDWVRQIEALGRRREEADEDAIETGPYYRELHTLGYDARVAASEDDD